ncbi:MAG: SGNH/GDSL hydrolase family protein, partial [Nitrospinae bacterium]|nr:SGNH/GDSL hydrolase family protein [Nitrospinota bacterium]
MKIKNYITNLVLLLMGLVLAFIATEALLRVYNPFQFRIKGNKISLPVYFHYNFELKDAKQLDKVVSHTKNSLGFRGEERPAKFDEHLTIITVGGSTTENFLITDGKTWPAILGKKANESFKHVWVNNAGLDGHSTFGHIVLMKDFITNIKPKVVLFLVGINDLWAKTSNIFDSNPKNDLTLNYSSIKGFLRT